MTTLDAILIGAFLGLAGLGVFLASRAAWGILKTIPDFRESLKAQHGATLKLVAEANAIVLELQYMRTLANAQAGQVQSADVAPITGYAGSTPPGAIPQFPSPIFDRFPSKPVEDAKMEDTDDVSLTQNDEDMAQLEQIEKLRQQGIQVDEPDVEHPGLTVESQ